jgi:hypothetical protein
MFGRALNGLIAGAAGTAALNMLTYLDVLIRARPSSSVASKTAARLADEVGVDLRADAEQGTQRRRSAVGALLGYLSGVGIGALYGAIEDAVPDLPLPMSGIAVGLAAMAGSDLPATSAGATDSSKWGASGWIEDVVPHIAYGVVTVGVYRLLRD